MCNVTANSQCPPPCILTNLSKSNCQNFSVTDSVQAFALSPCLCKLYSSLLFFSLFEIFQGWTIRNPGRGGGQKISRAHFFFLTFWVFFGWWTACRNSILEKFPLQDFFFFGGGGGFVRPPPPPPPPLHLNSNGLPLLWITVYWLQVLIMTVLLQTFFQQKCSFI